PAGCQVVIAWEEAPADAVSSLYVWLRMWNPADWIELAGSASCSGFTQPFTQNGAPQVVVQLSDLPVVAWNARTPALPAPQIFVQRWNGSDAWQELGFHSATDAGISDATLEAFAPALALSL